jgi:hypothetical protein
MKKMYIFIIILVFPISGNAQNNPDNEILVFFSEGIEQETKTVNNITQKTFKFTSDILKVALSSIGVDSTLLEVALPKFNKSDTLTILDSGERLQQPDMTNLYRIKVPEDGNRQDIIEMLRKIPEVLYAEPNGKAIPHSIPSDTRFNEQWGLKNTMQPGNDIHAEAAWEIYTGSSINIIAIIDGGTNTTHEDLNNKITGGDTGFGWNGHGIHVSGIAAAESNNSQGISGVDWLARIHPQRIDNLDDVGLYQAIIDAVNYSSNVNILNNSYGLIDENGYPGRYSTTVRQAFAYAYKANRTSIVSMGNHQDTLPGLVGYPAGFGNVIAVGATNRYDVIADFSSQGTHIDVCAPGVNVLSTVFGGYGYMSGTSMATPHVSGIASLLKGFNSNFVNDDIENIIKISADDKGVVGFDNAYGYGRVNAEKALNQLLTPNTVSQWSATTGTIVSSTGQFQMVFMGAQGLATSTYIVKRHEVRKTINYPSQFYQIEGVWGRGVVTNGWNLANPNFGEGFCEVVPGTQTNTSVTLRTYVYEVWSTLGSYLGYYPASPSNVSFAYTVLGMPVFPIVGPSILCSSGGSYSISNVPSGASITWSSSTGIARTSAQGSNPCNFIATNSGTTGWVSATITYNGNNISLPQKTMWLGGVPSPELYANNATLTGSDWYTVVLNTPDVYFCLVPDPTGSPIYPDTWEVEGDSYWYTNGSFLEFVPNVLGENIVAGYRHNTCGFNGTYFTIEVVSSKSGEVVEDIYFKLSPNPANEYVDIKLALPDEEKMVDSYRVDFVDSYSRNVKQVVLSGLENRVNIQDLHPGYYVVLLRYNGEVYSNKLILE